jgi:hypothetical protein
MDTRDVAPWARAKLGEAQMQLLRRQRPHARIGITGRSPAGPWVVRYHEGNLHTEARGADLIDTILDAFAQANRAGLELVS